MKKHDFSTCAAVDHHYWSYLVVWCPHRQAFVASRSSYEETGIADEPADYERQVVDLGPFDMPLELLQLMVGWLNDAHAEWVATGQLTPPPGSPG